MIFFGAMVRVRVEREQIPAFNNNNIDLKWGWGDKIAPRLGVAYALTGDGKTKRTTGGRVEISLLKNNLDQLASGSSAAPAQGQQQEPPK